MSTETPSRASTPALPDRQAWFEAGLVAYFLGLLLAPVILPPLLAAGGGPYAQVLLQVLGVVLVGYLVGLVILLRPVDDGG